jgi:hypothetical protein
MVFHQRRIGHNQHPYNQRHQAEIRSLSEAYHHQIHLHHRVGLTQNRSHQRISRLERP